MFFFFRSASEFFFNQDLLLCMPLDLLAIVYQYDY